MKLTSSDAVWILGILPTSAPFHPNLQWMEKRNSIAIKLEAIGQGDCEQADSPDNEIRANCEYLGDTCADCEDEDCPIISRRG